MSWSDQIVRSGKIVNILMPFHHKSGVFGSTIRLVVEQSNGRTFVYTVAMAGVRNMANGILGHHSSSFTEIREAFIGHALYSTFISYVQYGKERHNFNQVQNHGWTIL